ncbi:DASH family cryptochrome [Winogradskyella sp. A3E31]|uniref:DASH family cryptochrome n=1 Tax=Winogradskyella sp. A3E31 TaxID=3349637 RepID=UPI00398A96FB
MSEKQEITHLVWFRNDLRVADNDVLQAASSKSAKVLAVYCFDPRHFKISDYGFRKTEKFRAQFLIDTVKGLKDSLSKFNIELLVYNDYPENVIPLLCNEYGVTGVYIQKEWTQEEIDVEQKVKDKIDKPIGWTSLYNQFLYHPEDVTNDYSKIPQVFTVFRKKLEKQISVRKTVSITQFSDENRLKNTTKVPTLKNLGFEDFELNPNSAFPFKGGESSALERLNNYFFETKKLGFYKKTRNGLLGTDYSSKFSPWLANGSLSARTIYWKVKEFEKEHFKNQSTYWLVFELIWRDYFKYVSLKYGNSIFKLGGILHKKYNWSTDKKAINQWVHGNTASDFVNANMKEIAQTGWMSNRGRQNVASFFAKELKLDWRIGAAYFESLLLDYDVHSNYGNWMYVAGVGNDPRDRKFNVKSQAERYDPNGKFRNLWLQPQLF